MALQDGSWIVPGEGQSYESDRTPQTVARACPKTSLQPGGGGGGGGGGGSGGGGKIYCKVADSFLGQTEFFLGSQYACSAVAFTDCTLLSVSQVSE